LGDFFQTPSIPIALRMMYQPHKKFENSVLEKAIAKRKARIKAIGIVTASWTNERKRETPKTMKKECAFSRSGLTKTSRIIAMATTKKSSSPTDCSEKASPPRTNPAKSPTGTMFKWKKPWSRKNRPAITPSILMILSKDMEEKRQLENKSLSWLLNNFKNSSRHK